MELFFKGFFSCGMWEEKKPISPQSHPLLQTRKPWIWIAFFSLRWFVSYQKTCMRVIHTETIDAEYFCPYFKLQKLQVLRSSLRPSDQNFTKVVIRTFLGAFVKRLYKQTSVQLKSNLFFNLKRLLNETLTFCVTCLALSWMLIILLIDDVTVWYVICDERPHASV